MSEVLEQEKEVEVEETKKEEPVAKVYKQTDVDNITAKVKETAKKELLESDELKAFKNWQEQQKTEQEKFAEEKKQLEEEKQQLAKDKLEAQETKRKALISAELAKNGADLDSVDYVATLVKGDNVADEVTKLLEEKPHLVVKRDLGHVQKEKQQQDRTKEQQYADNLKKNRR